MACPHRTRAGRPGPPRSPAAARSRRPADRSRDARDTRAGSRPSSTASRSRRRIASSSDSPRAAQPVRLGVDLGRGEPSTAESAPRREGWRRRRLDHLAPLPRPGRDAAEAETGRPPRSPRRSSGALHLPAGEPQHGGGVRAPSPSPAATGTRFWTSIRIGAASQPCSRRAARAVAARSGPSTPSQITSSSAASVICSSSASWSGSNSERISCSPSSRRGPT